MDRATDLGSVASSACLWVRDPHPPPKVVNAGMPKLADGMHLECIGRKSVGVRVPVPA